jgi:hypothetical protein
MIGDDPELLNRHIEYRTGIDRHRFLPREPVSGTFGVLRRLTA